MPCFLDLITPQIHSVGSLETVNWLGPERVIYDHELLLVYEGECRTVLPDQTIVSPPGSYIIKPCGVRHSATQTSRGQIHFQWVHFDWNHMEPALTDSSAHACYAPATPRKEFYRPAPAWIPPGVLHGPIPSPESLSQLFIRMYERWNFGTGKERAACRVVLLEILIELLGERFGYFRQLAPENRTSHLANRIREMLNRMLEDPRRARLPLETELSKLGYSYPHLCRLFKKSFGISPLTYYNNLRMEHARQLLRDTLSPINEVALHVGIANAAYFTRLFTQCTGQTPRDYRMSNP
jgi:AraC-like DNA-binding protein